MQRRRPSRKYQLPYANRGLPVDKWEETVEAEDFEDDGFDTEEENVFEDDIYPIQQIQLRKKAESEFSWLIYAAATGGTFLLLKAFVG